MEINDEASLYNKTLQTRLYKENQIILFAYHQITGGTVKVQTEDKPQTTDRSVGVSKSRICDNELSYKSNDL